MTMLDTGNSAGYPLRTVLIVVLGNNAHRAKENDSWQKQKRNQPPKKK